jgi:peptide/nickel transport system permease protein
MAAPLPNAAFSNTGVLAAGPPPQLPSLIGSRRMRGQKIGRALALWVPAGILILLLLMCFGLPLVMSLPSPTDANILAAGLPMFSPGHPFGTTQVGFDVFSQIVYGGQVAFEVAFSVSVIGVVIGGIIGITAGYFGGWVDAILSRVLDILIAFPALVLALAIAEGLGPSEIHVIWALSVFSIPAFGRVARGATLTIRGLPFMTASRLSGTRAWKAIIKHVLPNIAPAMITFSLLGIGITIILEGALDYLGEGIPVPEASWGSMIANGQTVITAQPQYVLVPTVFLILTVVAVNLLGDALRERWGVQ